MGVATCSVTCRAWRSSRSSMSHRSIQPTVAMHSLRGRGQAGQARPTIRETESPECASNRRDLPSICPGSPIHCCDEKFTTPQRRGADLAVPKPREVSISSVKFERYKAFRSFSISLQRVNILVGPNNCGTIIRAFRVLDIALRQARRRNAQRISYNGHTSWGHRLSEDRLPISLENIHTDYEDTDAKVTFRCSNGNFLILVFPPDGGCFLIPDAQGRDCRTPGNFKNRFPIDIQVVPELGPLEDEEILLAEETVRRGLSTHRASRHFRNYWHLYPQGFDEFAELVSQTWPNMSIEPPEPHLEAAGASGQLSQRLTMFCLEDRMTREIYWSGFGFQVWCQLLTHISRGRSSTMLIVDEPEVYLHPDVQHQLVGILRDAGPDIVAASHSTEIIGEADPTEILVVDKTKQSATRLKEIGQVQGALDAIGSIHNISLTHLARTGRMLYVEGPSDFRILRRFLAGWDMHN